MRFEAKDACSLERVREFVEGKLRELL